MKKKNITFSKNYESEIPKIYVDENQIEQVLINLFLNSLDAMDKGDSITVNFKTAEDTATNDPAETKVSVFMEIVDTGCGIESDHIERIFNPFFTTKSDGVGLGLSISSRLVEENGGTIMVESELGQGSKFILQLPTS